MWFDGSHFQGFQRLRHACDQGDGLTGYGYHKHNGRSFAQQKLNDGPSNIEITTEFIKVPGGRYGGDWAVRIRGQPIHPHVPSTTSAFFYFGLEGAGSMDIVSKVSSKGLASPVKLEGDTPDLGDFEIEIVDGTSNQSPQDGIDQDLSKTQWIGLTVPEGNVWRAKDIIAEQLLTAGRSRVQQGAEQDIFSRPHAYFTLGNQLIEDEGEVANFYAFQKVFRGEFQFDVIFRSQDSHNKLTSNSLDHELIEKEREFDDRFEQKFHLQEKGFNEEQVAFGQFLLSNLLGGIGYFYGSAVVDRSHSPMQDEETFAGEAVQSQLTAPQSLFSATPSRPFFPRGFYWDEGFHQLLVGNWDNDLSLEIIKSWVSSIDENGWIAREQILGDEARSKVPAEFQTQFPHYANPPTLYLAIKRYVDRLKQHRQAFISSGRSTMSSSAFDDDHLPLVHLEHQALAQDWLSTVYPSLRRNWQWFRQTQRGHLQSFSRSAPNEEEAYRWRGRTRDHTLTSGLDDYPRGEPPNIGELHVDLFSWMTFATQLLKDIAISIDIDGELQHDIQEYETVEKNLLANLDALHWSDIDQAYCDQTADGQGRTSLVCHKGYITLFPMVLGLLPSDSPKLGAILDMIEDEEQLWSPYGLRSLSASDPFYKTGEVYWRGPIWMNLNYLTLQSLHNNYMNTPGPYQERSKIIYTNLRNNLISTVFNDYQKTGYVWEQYSDDTGEGLRSHPFTGWTSLILLMMAEIY
ncbi:glycoside hydrolase [Halteromyces radiatus]|uniref:glycoside hydrolase n=1 Tax=Halteromyces radiatus TaxID=101107 RepID=UPI00221EA0D1|nr:glycoside hydrolase [Halteromyces radiatus]KAI8099053.1 glycoside hydrolase [Halteromyces radiatus]